MYIHFHPCIEFTPESGMFQSYICSLIVLEFVVSYVLFLISFCYAFSYGFTLV